MSAPVACRYCGCTDDRACEGGCSWHSLELNGDQANICSACDSIAIAIGYRVLEELRACGVPAWSAISHPAPPPEPGKSGIPEHVAAYAAAWRDASGARGPVLPWFQIAELLERQGLGTYRPAALEVAATAWSVAHVETDALAGMPPKKGTPQKRRTSARNK